MAQGRARRLQLPRLHDDPGGILFFTYTRIVVNYELYYKIYKESCHFGIWQVWYFD